MFLINNTVSTYCSCLYKKIMWWKLFFMDMVYLLKEPVSECVKCYSGYPRNVKWGWSLLWLCETKLTLWHSVFATVFLINLLSCNVPWCSLLYYFTLSNARWFCLSCDLKVTRLLSCDLKVTKLALGTDHLIFQGGGRKSEKKYRACLELKKKNWTSTPSKKISSTKNF
jgi:hypothetical protein